MDRVVTQEQENTISVFLDRLIQEGRVGSEGHSVRIFRVGADGDNFVRGAERLAEVLQTEFPSLCALKPKTLSSRVNRYLEKRLGNMYHQRNGHSAKEKRTLARMAQAELKRRLGQMSVAELAALVKK